MPRQKWFSFCYAGLTALFVFPISGALNPASVFGLPLNLVWLVACLASYVALAVAWFNHPQTRRIVAKMDEEAGT